MLLWSAAQAPAPAQTTGLGQSVELVDPDVLRVCADPHNMPFSNEKEEGFEQALAKLLAPKLGRKSVSYTYFPQATGFVRMTLGARRCDIIMGYPQGDELVQNTNPYYRSSYALVFAGLGSTVSRPSRTRVSNRRRSAWWLVPRRPPAWHGPASWGTSNPIR